MAPKIIDSSLFNISSHQILVVQASFHLTHKVTVPSNCHPIQIEIKLQLQTNSKWNQVQVFLGFHLKIWCLVINQQFIIKLKQKTIINNSKVFLPSTICVGYYFERRRSLAIGISICGSSVGTFIFSPLGTYLVKEYGWRGTILVSLLL
jgi:hypothetical protein